MAVFVELYHYFGRGGRTFWEWLVLLLHLDWLYWWGFFVLRLLGFSLENLFNLFYVHSTFLVLVLRGERTHLARDSISTWALQQQANWYYRWTFSLRRCAFVLEVLRSRPHKSISSIRFRITNFFEFTSQLRRIWVILVRRTIERSLESFEFLR